MRPHFSSTACAIASVDSWSETSVGTAIASPPASPISAAVFSAAGPLMSAMTTRAPSSANRIEKRTPDALRSARHD